MCILYIFIIKNSTSINIGLSNSIDQIKISAHNNTDRLNNIREFYTKVKDAKLGINFDEINFNILVTGLQKDLNHTITVSDDYFGYENIRNILTILLFVFYVIICIFSVFAFFKRRSNWILTCSIILLFTIPVLVFYTGLLTSYFYFYSDLCDSVYSAIYDTKMPIHGRGLGWLTSCFDIVSFNKLEY